MAINDILMAASGAEPDKTYIEDVFSTYLYTGNGSTQTINNGIDLAGKGGMVWQKMRSSSASHIITDTVRGAGYFISSNNTSAQTYNSSVVSSFNSDGFTDGGSQASGATYASWTFRKAPKFFDVVTYTGDGVAGRMINHSLGSVPGMIIIKCTSAANDWLVAHRATPTPYSLSYLNTTDSFTAVGNLFTPTDTQFKVSNGGNNNASGQTYVAYLFAHDTSTDGLIQCGSFTSNESLTTITLGWEPQYLLVKRADSTGDWRMFDTMRGMTANGADQMLYANTSGAEITTNSGLYAPTATGFTAGGNVVAGDYIYMAIRRGPMRTPTDGTKVFAPVVYSSTGSSPLIVNVGIAADLWINNNRDSSANGTKVWYDRLRGNNRVLRSNDTSSESNEGTAGLFFTRSQNSLSLEGISGYTNASISGLPYIDYAFRRAPGFFDEVCYTGTGDSMRNVNHNLNLTPEFVIVKNRNSSVYWAARAAYAAPLALNSSSEEQPTSNLLYTKDGYISISGSSSTTFLVLAGNTSGMAVNASGQNYVAYLFASCPGVSKVGSYTGNGSSQTINCGFTNGARFVLIKRTDSNGDWYVWDTARGIVAGTDPHLSLNTTAAEVTTDDTIDPASTGFIVNQDAATNVNVSGASYIFLAIA